MRSVSRREVLAAFLGAPAAYAAWRLSRGRSPPRLPGEGEIVGPSFELGHRLRDTSPPVVPEDSLERVPVVIVGGGAAGLSAAWRLERAGLRDFVLLELEREPGGTSRYGTRGVAPHPFGAHYIAAPSKENRALVALLDEMGVIDGVDARGDPAIGEAFRCRDPEERVFYRGRWYEGLYLHAGETAQDREDLRRLLLEVGQLAERRDERGRRAFAIPVASASDDDALVRELDKKSMAEWLLERGLRSERLRWLIDYACRDDYGTPLAETSAWAGLFYFAARLPHLGEETRGLVTWPEGNGRIIAHLLSKCRDRARLGVAAADVVPFEKDGRAGVDVIAVSADGKPSGFRAERVVFAAPQLVARRAIRPFREAPPPYLAEFEYGAWLVANLHLRDRPPPGRGFPLSWDNVLRDSPSLGYVVATHQLGLDHGPTIFTWYHPLCDRSPREARAALQAASFADLADVALADVERAHPEIRSLVTRVDVARWGHAMVRPRPGFQFGGARERAARPFRGIHFASTDLSGVALFEEALAQGVRAAEEVLAARGVAFRPL